MPNLCYNLLNQRQLVRRMMDVGLPLQGSRNEMIRRHREFTLQFNAALDSSRPKTPQQVVQHILREEGNSKQKGALHPTFFFAHGPSLQKNHVH